MRTALQRTLLPVSIACASLVAACGGGGGSADTSQKASANSDVSASNYQSFAAPLARTVLDVGGGASVSDVFAGGATAQSTALVKRALGLQTLGRARIQSAGRQAVVTSPAESCGYAGTITVSINDVNNNQQLDIGDSISVSASGCRFVSTDLAMNGGFSMTLQKLQLDGQNNLTSLQVSGSFANLSIGSDALNGGFSLSLAFGTDGSETLQMGFSNLTTTHSGQSVTYNVTMNASTASTGAGTFSINGTLQQGSQVYLLEQSQSFSIPPSASHPVSGTLRLEDAAGDALVLEAKTGDLVNFKFYPAGTTTPAQELSDQAWSTYGG